MTPNLNPAETLILKAMLSSKYSKTVSRPDTQRLLNSAELSLKSKECRYFNRDSEVVLEWMLNVVQSLLDESVFTMPSRGQLGFPQTFEEVRAAVVLYLDTIQEAARKEAQDELEDRGAEEFTKWYPNAEVQDGTVTHPWGSKETRWFLENVTLNGIWFVYDTVHGAVMDNVAENLSAWSRGEKTDSRDPQEVAANIFEEKMVLLRNDIEEVLRG